ncbi:nuclear transport factor 2 family protein [Arthrobacter livingstonensis]|uniref:Nuclear transport factor 2 family protein n=1 Tax=Arthrobacter livingstonensis TaxID=670078 RepID=A0A2V5LD65_9MICC|nr:nuclear transport factor 2 family protein [Arthrobacter livingstonensis]PYI69595.1 nuclear transport factor 2 family protein [Arthrobacter livingstonensis]
MKTSESLSILPDGPVRRMFEATNRHDIEALVACFAEDYVNETPNHPDRGFTGRGQVQKNWSALFAGVPDLHAHVVGAATGPDGRIWVEWGTGGTRPDGGTVSMAGMVIFTVTTVQITAARFYLEPVEHGSGDVDAAVSSVATGIRGGTQPGGLS